MVFLLNKLSLLNKDIVSLLDRYTMLMLYKDIVLAGQGHDILVRQGSMLEKDTSQIIDLPSSP